MSLLSLRLCFSLPQSTSLTAPPSGGAICGKNKKRATDGRPYDGLRGLNGVSVGIARFFTAFRMTRTGSLPFAKRFFDCAQNDGERITYSLWLIPYGARRLHTFATRMIPYRRRRIVAVFLIFPQRKPAVCISLAERQISRFRKKTYHENKVFISRPLRAFSLRLPRYARECLFHRRWYAIRRKAVCNHSATSVCNPSKTVCNLR